MKKRVAVFFGGASSEYGVSLVSARAVIEAIDQTKISVTLIGITQQGKWLFFAG